MEHLIVESFLMLFIVFTEIRNYKERKGLLDRLMSRDYTEFATFEEKKFPIPDKKQKIHGIPL